MSRFLRVAPWLLMWGAFFLIGLWLNNKWPEGVARFQVHGYDYSDYTWFLSDWHEIFYPRPRHPLFGVLFFPMAVVCGWLKSISSHLCFWVFNAFFAAVMAASSYLVARISKGGISAAILYASFASMMLAVDVGIHFVCGWGMHEPHLYAGHWTFAIPIFILLAIQKMKSRRLRQISNGVVAAYGAGLAVLNLHAFGVI